MASFIRKSIVEDYYIKELAGNALSIVPADREQCRIAEILSAAERKLEKVKVN